ncbi:Vacuolar protein sorting-associated protein 55-like [Glycine soja]|nr:Vacuolar protein sorting-associated protein 55-like [Glycine soja]
MTHQSATPPASYGADSEMEMQSVGVQKKMRSGGWSREGPTYAKARQALWTYCFELQAKARRAHHVAQWLISSLAWSMRRDKSPRFAIGSYLEHYTNKVELVHHFNHDTFNFTSDPRLVLNHPYEPILGYTQHAPFGRTGDGSVRVFDLRDKEKSTIIYENAVHGCPLLRLNGIKVTQDSGRHLCSLSDDARAFIWEVMDIGFSSGNGCDVLESGRKKGGSKFRRRKSLFGICNRERRASEPASDIRSLLRHGDDSTRLAGLAFMFSASILLQILACAIYNNWWPMLSALMYVLVPMPCLFFGGGSTQFLMTRDGGGWIDAAKFLTGASAVGSLAIPIILKHAHMIETGAMLIELVSFFIFICTVLCFHQASLDDDW